MAYVIIFLAIILLGLCLTEGDSRKIFISVILALLSFPLGVIMAFTKRYK